jgi:hypothetical protein
MEAEPPTAEPAVSAVKSIEDSTNPVEAMAAFKAEHASLWQNFTTTVDGIIANLQKVQTGAEEFATGLGAQGVGTVGGIKDKMKDVRAATTGGPDLAAIRARSAAMKNQFAAQQAGGR